MDREILDRLGATLRREHASAEHAGQSQETEDRGFDTSLYKLVTTIRKPKARRFSLGRAWRQI